MIVNRAHRAAWRFFRVAHGNSLIEVVQTHHAASAIRSVIADFPVSESGFPYAFHNALTVDSIVEYGSLFGAWY